MMSPPFNEFFIVLRGFRVTRPISQMALVEFHIPYEPVIALLWGSGIPSGLAAWGGENRSR